MVQVKINKLEEDLYRRGDKVGAISSMLARFHRLVQASGVLRDLKKHEFYEKPSTKRRRKQREAKLRRLRKERKDALRKPRVPRVRGRRDRFSATKAPTNQRVPR